MQAVDIEEEDIPREESEHAASGDPGDSGAAHTDAAAAEDNAQVVAVAVEMHLDMDARAAQVRPRACPACPPATVSPSSRRPPSEGHRCIANSVARAHVASRLIQRPRCWGPAAGGADASHVDSPSSGQHAPPRQCSCETRRLAGSGDGGAAARRASEGTGLQR